MNENNSVTSNAVPVHQCGPLVQWWCTGFDSGEKHVIGVSTESADYYLVQPSANYIPFFQEVDKIKVDKGIITFNKNIYAG
jgi:hypothetical protein